MSLNPDSKTFTPSKSTGLRADHFNLSFDNVTDRKGKFSDKSDVDDEGFDKFAAMEEEHNAKIAEMEAERKALLEKLEAEREKAEEDVPDAAHSPDDMASAFLSALKKLMEKGTDNDIDTKYGPPLSGTVLSTGLSLPAGVRHSEQNFTASRVQVSRFNRGKTVEARQKLRDRVCVKLEHTLALTKWDEILDTRSDLDLATAVISLQTQLDCVIEFAVIYDIAYLCNVPQVNDMSDKSELGYCRHFVNLLTDHASLDPEQVKSYQSLINLQCGDTDVESSEWLLKVLEKSTERTLLVTVKQTMKNFKPHERGGLTFFKTVVDKISSNSFEFLQAGVNYITEFRLSKFAGEDVMIATSRFLAVVTALPPSSLPPKTVEYYLIGMADCSCEEFQQVVIAQKGSLYAPWYRLWLKNDNISVVDELNMVSRPLEEKYTALTTKGIWSGAHKKNSIFRAVKSDKDHRRTPARPDQPRKHKYASREEWFDAQICKTCGKNHPTYRIDLIIRGPNVKRYIKKIL
jgi:hypothetical protein